MSLLKVQCTECFSDSFFSLSQSPRLGTIATTIFVCRRCKLVKFAEAAETLLIEGPLGVEVTSEDDAVEYNSNSLLLISQLRELYDHHLGT